MSFFGELERLASDLYPYRWLVAAVAALALAVAAGVAWRAGWHRIAWRHRLVSALVAVSALVVVLPGGWYTLSPLWERSSLEEASPLVVAAAEPTASSPSAAAPTPTVALPDSSPTEAPDAFEPRVIRTGELEGADSFHFGEGSALLIETAPGRYTLRFEEFSVRNGPDLFVYLSPGEDAGDALNLGGLKATDGAFNYDVPPGTDVSAFRYVIVWCRQFSVLFASAPLGEA